MRPILDFLQPLVLIAYLLSPLAFAGQVTGGAPARSEADGQLKPSLDIPVETVAPGDLLSISVANWTDVSRTYQISGEGTISLPVVAKPFFVTGLTATQIEQMITRTFQSERIMVDPIVGVSVLEYRSRAIDVAGAVRHPVTFQATAPVRLLDAIAKADGLSAEAGSEVLVSRPNDLAHSGEITRIPVKQLMESSDVSLNLLLHGGEQIRVPEAGKLYVVGNIKLPGAYQVNESQGMSVLKALALCQGLLPFSQDTAVVYRTAPDSKTRKEIEIPVKEIMKRRAPDVLLHANDIFYIPDNSGRRLSAQVLDRLGTFSGATVSGLLIWK